MYISYFNEFMIVDWLAKTYINYERSKIDSGFHTSAFLYYIQTITILTIVWSSQFFICFTNADPMFDLASPSGPNPGYEQNAPVVLQ